jgi:Flavin containing amine oxidoreductase
LLDLIGTQSMSGAVLEQTSVSNFFRSRSYSTEGSIAASARTLAEAFASPSYLSSARSYQSLVKYGYPNPAPALWLLTQNTNDAIFEPWRRHLEARAETLERRFDIQYRTRVEALHLRDGQVRGLTLGEMPEEPTTDRNDEPVASKTWQVDVPGDLVLTVPPGPLGRLVSPEVAACAPKLETVRELRSEPMISLDAYFKCRIPGLTKSITLLLGSKYNLSLLDISQVWSDWPAGGGTALNIISSNADLIANYPKEVIKDVMLKELQRFLDFKLDDVDYDRCHVQTNVGEELFVNQVGSWEHRPKATCKIPNLFIAGDFCQNVVDVVTVEGAVVSGLNAAQAVCNRHRIGDPISILEPDSYPVMALSALAMASAPLAYAARAVAFAEDAIERAYQSIFPNG